MFHSQLHDLWKMLNKCLLHEQMNVTLNHYKINFFITLETSKLAQNLIAGIPGT